MRFVWNHWDSTSWFLGCQCPPGPWRCALRGAEKLCPWSSWGKSWKITENHENIMQKSSMENNQWKIMEDTDVCFKPIAGSPRLALGKARAAFAVPSPRECPGFHGPTHEPKKRGPEKWPPLNHQKYIKISFKYKSSGVPRKRKPCWILGLKIFRTQSSNMMFL